MYLSLRSNFIYRSPRSTQPRIQRRIVKLLLCVVLVSQVTTVQASQRSLQSQQTDSCVGNAAEAIWQTIKPGTVGSLSWTPCYPASNFTELCSKLTVPLDYTKPDGLSAVIALVKVPAVVDPTDPRYRGPILFNPGGPGGSGIDFINELGGFFQQVVGNEFDIVGFDPRGVGRTQPQVNIFPEEAEGAQWHIPAFYSPLYNTTPDAIPRMHANALTLASVAGARLNDVGPYVGTAQAVRDMLSITQAFGRDKLQYWGFSYGTVLGATFAAVFPDKIDRLIIDGVVDADDYYSTSWMKNLLGTDKEVLRIFQDCVDAGPDLCALYEPTAAQVHARFENILDNLKRAPIPVQSTGGTGPIPDYGVFEYKWAKAFFFQFLYSPYDGSAPSLMSALRALEDGDARPFWGDIVPFKPQCSCAQPPGELIIDLPEATTAISCSDGLPVNDTPEELEKVFQALTTQSEFGDVWALRAACVGWEFRPVERFAGPFMANTSFPILLIGNTDDPVAPLVNAHTMSQGFNGSVVLTQNSSGHASVAAMSVCTAKAVRDYFRDGVLPKEGTVCEIESTVFNGSTSPNLPVGKDSDELVIVDAWNTLNKFKSPLVYKGLPL